MSTPPAPTEVEVERPTMDQFLASSLQKMLKDTAKKQMHLRESCSSTLKIIETFGVTPKSQKREDIEQADKVNNKLIITLKLACESRQGRIMANALDCLEKLMAQGYIRPSIRDIENPDAKLMDKVIEIIGECFDFVDDAVQLQVLKAFLTAVSSIHCDVHDKTLVHAIRACFNIYLVNRNRSTQQKAKETLTEMLGIIFERFERASTFAMEEKVRATKEGYEMTVELPVQTVDEDQENDQSAQAKKEEEEEEKEEKEEKEEAPGLDDKLEQEKLKEKEENNIGGVVSPSEVPGQQGQRFHVATGNAALQIAYNDCSGIFKALCKLSSKELPESTSVDSVDMRRKLLALQLIESIIEQAGPMLQGNQRFISNAIKKYLFISLLQNGISPFIKVFRTSLSIFYNLTVKFKDNLRNEMGVYFSKIILRTLGSSNSSTQHKHVVLLLLLKVCKEAQSLVDIFLNFDCNLDSVDIFEHIVVDLSAIAKGTHISSGAPLTQQEASVRLLGLECLVTIMRSLVQWSSDLTDKIDGPHNESQDGTRATKPSAEGELIPEKPEDLSDKFTQQKHRKQQVEHGKKLFNYKPKKGIAFLTALGHIPDSPKGVAAFLLHAEGLDRTKIGDYIGDISNEFCKDVLYDYIDLQRFGSMEIYTALRKFLLGFRLPGEGQKIDAIMEKFAERYYTDNKNERFLFANADAVYIFAYHMIMLATDLHSHAIKKKITQGDWIKNNIGLNDGKDFPEKFLLDIYATVSVHPLKVRDDSPSAGRVQSELLSPKQRQTLFHKESESVVQHSQELIQEKLQQKTTFFKSTNIQHVKPMFESCWCPMLAALSTNLEQSQDTDQDVYTLCLEGFQCGIRVSSIFFMTTERNAFVSSLSQFTLLSNLREMKQKNIEAIKCLIQIAHSDGNYLQESWKQVLNCISQLAKIHMIGSWSTKVSATPHPHEDLQRQDSLGTLSIKAYENLNGSSVAEQINVDDIDKIFSNTVHLNDDAIVFFVQCLCSVSEHEVDCAEPRTFSLQKLIEIAYYNMTRIRFVWSRIWGIMADHFKKVGLHKNKAISMYAVDSLRQLAMKFLEKDELANYHFQKDFLKPFEYIITLNRSLAIRELVVRCLTQMILARGKNIKSGWKSIFMVFTAAANETDESVVSLAFEITHKILTSYFPLISQTFFVDCVNCFIAFARNKHLKEIGKKAVEAIGVCAGHLAKGDVFEPEKNEEDGTFSFTDAERDMKFWFPILTGLSEVISHPHVDVRTSALDMLFDILLKFGSCFNSGLWELVFRGVLFPIFDNVRHSGDGSMLKEDNEWLTSTCLNALSLFVRVFCHFFERIKFLLNDCLALLTNCILQENQHLASIGVTTFLQLIMHQGNIWTPDMWSTICFTIHYIFTNNRPVELLRLSKLVDDNSTSTPSLRDVIPHDHNNTSPYEEEDSKSPPEDVDKNEEEKGSETPVDTTASSTIEEKLKKCTPKKCFPSDIHVISGKATVLSQLLESVKEISVSHISILSVDHFSVLLDSLKEVYEFAHTVNISKEIWGATRKSTLMSLIVRHENFAGSIYLDLLFRLYSEVEHTERVNLVEERLISSIVLLLDGYVLSAVPVSYATSKVPLVLQILKDLLNLTDEQFLAHLSEFYDSLSNLVVVPNKDIRAATRLVFQRIGHLHSFNKQ